METTRITTRCPAGIYEKIRKLAFDNKVSINDIYIQSLEFFLKALEEKKVEIVKTSK